MKSNRYTISSSLNTTHSSIVASSLYRKQRSIQSISLKSNPFFYLKQIQNHVVKPKYPPWFSIMSTFIILNYIKKAPFVGASNITYTIFFRIELEI